MRGQEEAAGMIIAKLGTKDGLFFSATAQFCHIEQRRNCSFLSSISDSNYKRSDRRWRVMTFIVLYIYMAST